MYLNINQTGKGFMGVYAPYPLEAELGGYGGINYVPTKRADYIAKTTVRAAFPGVQLPSANQRQGTAQ
jgi:alpha-glucosidase